MKLYIPRSKLILQKYNGKNVTLECQDQTIDAKVFFSGSDFEFLSKKNDDTIMAYLPEEISINLLNPSEMTPRKGIGAIAYNKNNSHFNARAYLLGMETNMTEAQFNEYMNIFVNGKEIIPRKMLLERENEKACSWDNVYVPKKRLFSLVK